MFTGLFSRQICLNSSWCVCRTAARVAAARQIIVPAKRPSLDAQRIADAACGGTLPPLLALVTCDCALQDGMPLASLDGAALPPALTHLSLVTPPPSFPCRICNPAGSFYSFKTRHYALQQLFVLQPS